MESSKSKQDVTRPPVVRAMQGWHWTCAEPSCRHQQFALKSTTHVAECKLCHELFTVAIVNLESRT